MDLVLQVHYSCKGATLTVTALVGQGCVPPPSSCSQPHGQRPVQSNVQHVEPERPVGLTSEACDVVSSGSAGGGGGAAPARHLFGLGLVVWRTCPPAAGAEAAEGTVAAPEVATSQQGGAFSPKAAASEVGLHRVSVSSHEGQRGTAGGAGQDRPGGDHTHLTHTASGLWKLDRLAAR